MDKKHIKKNINLRRNNYICLNTETEQVRKETKNNPEKDKHT